MLALLASAAVGLPAPTGCSDGQLECTKGMCFTLKREGVTTTSWLPGMRNGTLQCAPCSLYNVWEEDEGCVYHASCSTGPPCVVHWSEREGSKEEKWTVFLERVF